MDLIPPETLFHVFDFMCDHSAESYFTKSAPWTPSHVCRKWRQVTLSRPALWSTSTVADHEEVE
ncbi:hypothetical protein BDV98DRAFT_564349 [Pterulicium gracile]|uniref:Uncharacterized protein n=1 Tax=Pterulicium gracile TaxID=1884261 RepID=A0A5C3QRQ8_9AGAR|nr:hypothetical protein BDV98DRAFT_564349 [Pterula gracilis]